MSQARVNTSTFAARKGKTINCQGCRQPIEKGTIYNWFKVGFRSRFVHTYHLTCSIPDSARESSKMAGVMSAREDAQANVQDLLFNDTADALVQAATDALTDCASSWRDVAEEYREAGEAMGGAGENMMETADSIESAADDLEQWSPNQDEPDPCSEHNTTDPTCEDCTQAAEAWLEELRAEADEALMSAEGDIEVTY